VPTPQKAGNQRIAQKRCKEAGDRPVGFLGELTEGKDFIKIIAFCTARAFSTDGKDFMYFT
jgi:hypothetical protein